MANSKNVMAQVILPLILSSRDAVNILLVFNIFLILIPIFIVLFLFHIQYLSQHAVNLRFYSLNLGTEVRIC